VAFEAGDLGARRRQAGMFLQNGRSHDALARGIEETRCNDRFIRVSKSGRVAGPGYLSVE
jgi:hypothetical protein